MTTESDGVFSFRILWGIFHFDGRWEPCKNIRYTAEEQYAMNEIAFKENPNLRSSPANSQRLKLWLV